MEIANNFRSILIIFLIAILIYYFYLLLNKDDSKKIILSLILIVISFGGMNRLLLLYTQNEIGIKLDKNNSGWSVFVGSNIEYSGVWNEDDLKYFMNLVEEHGENKAHEIVGEKAIKRYKSYGIKNILFLAKKAKILGKNLPEYTYQDVFNFIENKVSITLNYFITIYLFSYMILILLFNIDNSYKLIKLNVKLNKEMMFAIFGLGVFLATLFVETHPRYFMPILIPLIFMAAYSIETKKLKEQ